MLSSRPYLARALYQWLLDNDQTPHMVVDAKQPGVEVPEQFVQNGQIVLNIAPQAVEELFMENDAISFSARFGGKPMRVMVPIEALIALYARENGVGMVFGHEPVMPEHEAEESDAENGAESDEAASEERPALSSVEDTGDEVGSDDEDAPKAPPKGRPSLRVIK
ncbi:stringent starvation protein B [Onishia taeanensis]|jgi:stringent starvation protein B|uniref:Stringent starvation protein B n=1 Tax=Onishia taeanensis TaxID=284577 RepID=A0A1G7R7K7_9GAMM|nr:ClpXP protease specificity-enhancing factor [Halomonas taeanensis]SDG06786.1 stringent starvation protein B [Halomonas taeanensis]